MEREGWDEVREKVEKNMIVRLEDKDGGKRAGRYSW